MTTSATIKEICNQLESWKAAHAQAMEVYKLQDCIALLSQVYQDIKRIDDAYAIVVRAEAQEYSVEVARTIESGYRAWVGAAKSILHRASEAQRSGHVVDGIDNFRELLLDCPAVFDLNGVIESQAQCRQHKLISRREAMNALRRRTDTSSH